MSASTKWITAIVGLLAANVIAMVILATVANVGHSEVIPDYYAKAAHYDDEMAQAVVNQRLAWRVDARIIGGELAVEVHDAAGRPIDGARLVVSGAPRTHAASRFELAPLPREAGRYTVAADDYPGVHDLTIVVERGGDRFVARAVVDAR